MRYVQASIATKEIPLREVLVAELAEIGFSSFDEDEVHQHAYIEEELYDEQTLHLVLTKYDVNAKISIMEQRNWNEDWEKEFSAVRVDDFCTIRATFHSPDADVEHEVIITPKMSFGTGHHATTQLMVRQMRLLDLQDKRVLDFGTGTGVLAILAEKLGAAAITAIDNDEWSYENAIENVGYNNCKLVKVLRGSLAVTEDNQYDIILANINRHILIESMTEMKRKLTVGGTLLMSGLLVEDEQLIASEAGNAGLTFISKMEQENWLCLAFIAT